jgi:hypothetical protein
VNSSADETHPFNPELRLAAEYVRDTDCNIFLTGKAGTGKTTFLHRIRENCPKRMVVTAPTGVAAINAGGVTLHSFFQLPFGPFVPASDGAHLQYRFSRQKLDIIKSLDLLVIDEISMVRADLFDAVDSVLRRFRRGDSPFGGVQLLMIGDLFQLPPVAKPQEWGLLRPYYESPYFFSSRALRDTETVTIELQHIYRQSDSRFIDLLNRVRDGRLDPASLQELNRRHIPGFVPPERDGYIILCTHNRMADTTNHSRLVALPGKTWVFEAKIEGEFPGHMYPAAADLRLKTQAQVMFLRNDLSPEKRYFNGKIGTITRISENDIRIRCPGEPGEIAIEPATWENIEYRLNPDAMTLTENKIGTFTQYPLALAWAITIHKSQGLTFDKAVIDTQAAFAHGQVYVALSRCRTLEGIVLSSPLSQQALKTDDAVRHFSELAMQRFPSAERLEGVKIRYQQLILTKCFNFERLRFLMGRLVALLLGNSRLIRISGVDDIQELQKLTEKEVCTVGDRFLRQLQGLFSESVLPASDAFVLERISKASVYFRETIESGIGKWIQDLKIDTDNKEIEKKAKSALALLQKETGVKLASVTCCEKGFSPSAYFQAVSAAEINTPDKKPRDKTPVYFETDIAHPELFQLLKAWRSRKAEAESISHYQVLHQKTLVQIAIHLPDSLPALKRVHGIGSRLAQRYGEEVIAMVREYRKQHDIREVALPSPTPAAPHDGKPDVPKIDTKRISLELFEKGMTLSQIARERSLATSTIEGHLAHFVETGRIGIELLLSAEKRQKIERELTRLKGKPPGEIKQALGTEVSYGEIKLVQAHLKNRAAS